MALFKPFRGSRTSLDSQPLHDGYAYFCTDDGSFHIDYVDDDGNLQRKQINAKEAETIGLHTADEFLLKTEWLQADWYQTDPTQPDYIKNKPTILSVSISDSVLLLTQKDSTHTSFIDNGVCNVI